MYSRKSIDSFNIFYVSCSCNPIDQAFVRLNNDESSVVVPRSTPRLPEHYLFTLDAEARGSDVCFAKWRAGQHFPENLTAKILFPRIVCPAVARAARFVQSCNSDAP